MTDRKRSQTQEKSVAKQLQGRVTAASGATDFSKGDVRTDVFLVECKTTQQRTYTFRYSTWTKIYNEALKDGLRIPLMCIDIRGERCFICDAELVQDSYFKQMLRLYDKDILHEDTRKQRQICGYLEFIVYSTPTKQHRLAVLSQSQFEELVLPNIGG